MFAGYKTSKIGDVWPVMDYFQPTDALDEYQMNLVFISMSKSQCVDRWKHKACSKLFG